jgi:hypothetical protein
MRRLCFPLYDFCQEYQLLGTIIKLFSLPKNSR